jgi:hypothetical protein
MAAGLTAERATALAGAVRTASLSAGFAAGAASFSAGLAAGAGAPAARRCRRSAGRRRGRARPAQLLLHRRDASALDRQPLGADVRDRRRRRRLALAGGQSLGDPAGLVQLDARPHRRLPRRLTLVDDLDVAVERLGHVLRQRLSGGRVRPVRLRGRLGRRRCRRRLATAPAGWPLAQLRAQQGDLVLEISDGVPVAAHLRPQLHAAVVARAALSRRGRPSPCTSTRDERHGGAAPQPSPHAHAPLAAQASKPAALPPRRLLNQVPPAITRHAMGGRFPGPPCHRSVSAHRSGRHAKVAQNARASAAEQLLGQVGTHLGGAR